MLLSKRAISEFQELAKKELGLELAEEEARKYTAGLLAIFAVAYRPIPTGLDPPPKDKGPPGEGRP